MRSALYFLFIVCLYSAATAQSFDNISSLQNVTIKQVYSDSVQDSFYVYIKLPDEYNDSKNSYPVLYVMDGDLIFPIACATTHYLNSGNYIPNMIIVGIGYGTMDWQKGNQRSRDYTAIAADGRPFEGGAPEYLNFINNELIPMIDNNYRTDKNERILMGHSLGGQFVLYTLLSSPNSFSKYIASSPFIFRIKEFYSSLLMKRINTIKESHSKVFISVGENELEEEYLNTIGDFTDNLIEKLNDTTKIKYKILSEGEHFINPPTALVFGLKWLYEN